MSKKSKKILAYLMFVAALCGTPAVSEARGGSGGQVKTEQAPASQSRGLGQSFFSYVVRNYGLEAAKMMFYGGGSFGLAKFLKAGDFNTWASYLLNLKDAESKKLAELKKKLEKDKEEFEKEKNSFEDQAKRNTDYVKKLFDSKNVLGIKNLALTKQVNEKKEVIEQLEEYNQSLKKELLDTKNYNAQLFNITEEDKRKLDGLLSSYLPIKITGELAVFTDGSWKQNSYNAGKVDVTPYSSNEGSVIVTSAKYDSNGVMLGDPEWLKLEAGELFGALAEKAGNGKLVNVSLKDIGLEYCGVPYLARYSYSADDGILAFYFPVKAAQEINVENNNNDGNENLNENEQNANDDANIVNNENNENNENVNNEDNN